MAERALPVTARLCQADGGSCALEQMISTSSPFLSSVVERHRPAVDLGADAGIADVGVDRIGKIDRVRAARQRDQAALGREAEHLILEQLELGVLEKLLGIVAVEQHADQMTQPAIGVGILRGDPALAVHAVVVLVERMRRHAIFGDGMHPLGADLQLDPLVARADDGGVDRLVVVLLRIGDVVLEAAGHSVPARVHDGKRAVAVLDLGHDDAERVDVGELLERDLLPLHLAPDGVGLLLAARHDALDSGLFELRGERRLDLVDQALVALAQNLEALDHRRVGLGVERLEGMVLELLAQPLHAHAPGERRIDVHGLLGDDLALGRLHMLERAHVVQAVGELDEQHADVAGDGEQQLAEVLRLLGLLGDEVELLDLGQAVDQRADLAPE